ncbi:hypothetical protein KY362_03035 [Candidatus Woesearchaeota archaeon]|nr:hypothetical protein [Candidatus Woesearchaeota archaeon]
MHDALQAVIRFLWNKKYIGKRHFPEKKLVISRTKWLSPAEKKQFDREYASAKRYLIRMKKRTGKQSDWHVSLNPEMLGELMERLENEE